MTLTAETDVAVLLDHLGFKPNSKFQEDILAAPHRFVQVTGGEQGGKHLHVDTPIATPDGWSRMGALVPGDTIFDEQGHPTVVEWVTEQEELPSYRLTFDNGDEIIASGSHKWWVQNYNAEEMMGGGTIRLAPHNRRPFANWSIPSPRPLVCPEADLPIDPYVLGTWLGDGNSDTAAITTADREILVNLSWAGVDVRPHAAPIHYGMGGSPNTGQDSLIPTLRELGVLNNKHIPQIYLRASKSQRLALLNGLMDTDGYIDKRGRTEFTTTREVLKDGFEELGATFGMSFTTWEKRAMLYGKDCGPVWNTRFQTKMPVFRLGRKAARQQPGKFSARSENVYIASIEPIGEQPVRCIGVRNDSHLYLAGKTMIPTHKSIT